MGSSLACVEEGRVVERKALNTVILGASRLRPKGASPPFGNPRLCGVVPSSLRCGGTDGTDRLLLTMGEFAGRMG